MTSPLPAHLAAAIAERIAVLRDAWRVDESHEHPPHMRNSRPASRQGHAPFGRPGSTPTFPEQHRDATRSAS